MSHGKYLTAEQAVRVMLRAPNCAVRSSWLNPSVVTKLLKTGWASKTGASVMLLPAGREAAERKVSAPADDDDQGD